MREISQAMARYLCNSGEIVYRLHEDGTEARILGHQEINEHFEDSGIFGTE